MLWMIAITLVATILVLFVLMLIYQKPPPKQTMVTAVPPSESSIDFYRPIPPAAPPTNTFRGGLQTQCAPMSKPMSSALPFANVPMAYATA